MIYADREQPRRISWTEEAPLASTHVRAGGGGWGGGGGGCGGGGEAGDGGGARLNNRDAGYH